MRKNDNLQKINDELKIEISTLKNKLGQKIKELEEINASSKILIQNKENIILKYEKELEIRTQDKEKLIEQNKQLLNNVTNSDNNNNIEDNNYFKNENMLLKEEIKTLKEKLNNQTNDLLSLNAMEKENAMLQIENEKLLNDNKNLKQRMQKESFDDSKEETLSNSLLISPSLSGNINNSSNKKIKKRLSITIVKDKPITNKIIPKKISMPIIQKENEKINENEEILLQENEKLKEEITKLKVKYLNMEFEKETKIVKYKNILKGIEKQIKKVGIKLDLNYEHIQ
jgi:hypothetical protein